MYNELSTNKIFKIKATQCTEAIKRFEDLCDNKTELESDYEPFIILIRMIEAGHKNEDLQLNIPRCKKRINYLAGFKYFDI